MIDAATGKTIATVEGWYRADEACRHPADNHFAGSTQAIPKNASNVLLGLPEKQGCVAVRAPER